LTPDTPLAPYVADTDYAAAAAITPIFSDAIISIRFRFFMPPPHCHFLTPLLRHYALMLRCCRYAAIIYATAAAGCRCCRHTRHADILPLRHVTCTLLPLRCLTAIDDAMIIFFAA